MLHTVWVCMCVCDCVGELVKTNVQWEGGQCSESNAGKCVTWCDADHDRVKSSFTRLKIFYHIINNWDSIETIRNGWFAYRPLVTIINQCFCERGVYPLFNLLRY